MSPNSATPTDAMNIESLLRSINVVYDIDAPERIAHFRPTPKSVSLLHPLLLGVRGSASVVVAPYGSAKSLTATFAGQVVENRNKSKSVLNTIAKRAAHLSPALTKLVKSRTTKDVSGLAFVLNGSCENLPEALRVATLGSLERTGRKSVARRFETPWRSIKDFFAALKIIHDSAARPDQILIVWDEFGRHLESLISAGRTNELNDLQNLAEYATRQEQLPTSIALLMHQPLVQYAGSATQSVRNEWMKIAGRFETIEFIDDSNELMKLIADAIASRRSTIRIAAAEAAEEYCGAAKRMGLFRDLNIADLVALARAAAPMDLVALSTLPRISARIAQNERTLFTFLASIDANRPIGLAEVYDYFAGVMRSDTGIGGTYRQYIEAESAISRSADTPSAHLAIKATALLNLGMTGARSKAARPIVELALRPYANPKEIKKLLDELIDRKVLLYRKHANELAVWHGADVDIRGRVESEMASVTDDLDFVSRIARESAPPSWRPTAYNSEHRITRFYESIVCSRYDLDAVVQGFASREGTRDAADGAVVYVLAETDEEIAATATFAASFTSTLRNLVIAIPSRPLGIRTPVKELHVLMQLHRDKELVASDPLVASELQQMIDDARSHLQRTLDGFMFPEGLNARWFADGSPRKLGASSGLSTLLSLQMQNRFPQCPVICNELIVRRRPSAVVVNARKKLVLAILERTGRPMLGIEGQSADYSLFRSLLLNTGIYPPPSGPNAEWAFAPPERIPDSRLGAVWSALRDFVSSPQESPKDLVGFFASLRAAPFGLRDGVIPILFAAALKAFPAPLVIARDGEYVPDILPSTIEDICRSPKTYTLSVVKLGSRELRYLKGLHSLFSSSKRPPSGDDDYIRLCFDAIEAWKRQLPPASMKSFRLAPVTRRIRDALSRSADARLLLLRDLPVAADSSSDLLVALERVSAAKQELEDVPRQHEEAAASSIRRTLGLADKWDKGLRGLCDTWFAAIPDSIRTKLRANRDDPRPGALLERMSIRYDQDEDLLNSICSLMVDSRVSRWEDSTPAQFARAFDDTIQRIEAAAVDASTGEELSTTERKQIATLAESRVRAAIQNLARIVGPGSAATTTSKLLGEFQPKKGAS